MSEIRPEIAHLEDRYVMQLIETIAKQDDEIEHLRERCRIQEQLISDNADLYDEIERLRQLLDAQKERAGEWYIEATDLRVALREAKAAIRMAKEALE